MDGLPTVKSYVVEKAKMTNARQEMVKRFLDRYNARTKKPTTAQQMAIRLSHLTMQDLDAFYKQCDQARNFGAYFNWALRVKKHE